MHKPNSIWLMPERRMLVSGHKFIFNFVQFRRRKWYLGVCACFLISVAAFTPSAVAPRARRQPERSPQ